MKRILSFFFLVFILFGFARLTPVAAFEMRQGNDVTVAKDTLVKGSLVATGNLVTIDGTINGDLYCAGQTIVVRGTVSGDILCAGQTLDVSGTVGGNIRSMGQLLNIGGVVKRNVAVAGQTITLMPGAVISGEMLAAGQTINLNSTVVGDVNAAAQSILLGEKARVTGDFTYTSPLAMTEATGAAVTGKVSHIVPKKEEMKPITNTKWMPKAKPWPANAVAPILLYLVVGVIIVLVAREKVIRITTQMSERPWYDGLIGLLTFIIAPIVIVMVAITLIGIPLAIVLGVVYAIMIISARVYVSVLVGNKLLALVGKTKSAVLLQVIIGVIVVELVVKIPVLGALLSGLATLWGLGGIVANWGKRKAAK